MIDFEQVEDQIRAKQKSIRYDIRSHSISDLINRFQHGDLYIPHYQRNFVWTKKSQSIFIESIIIGLPTSSLFFAYTSDFRAEVVDGVQRLRTLEAFVNDDLKLTSLKELSIINGLYFKDLPKGQKKKFLSRAINVITLAEETSFAVRMEIFLRMNSGGVAKNSHDMRLALLDGAFIDTVRELADRDTFKSSINLSSFMKSRKENEEFLLRFICLSNFLDKYRGNMSKFIDLCINDLNENFDREHLIKEIDSTSIFVNKYLSDLFSNSKMKINKSIFDSIFVGVN
ncbi:MAG: DUF262 domain-containing protein [Enterobacterales bacterium]